jgi:hypothetical protein
MWKENQVVKSREQLIRKIEAQIAVADEIGSDFISLIKGEGKAIIRLLEEDEERIAIMAEGNLNDKELLRVKDNDIHHMSLIIDEFEKEKQRNPVIVCPHCGKRVK